MAHPNEELLGRYFTAADSGDLATLDELFGDNITAHIAGSHALAGEYQGKGAVFGAIRAAGSSRSDPDGLPDSSARRLSPTTGSQWR